MKKNILFVLIAFLCLGCEDKADENTITIDSYNLEFPPEGGTLSFNITCATDWDILRMYNNDGIELSTQHGTGNQTVNVTLRPNEYSVAKQRLLAIRAANGVTKQLFVSQYAKNGGNKLFQMTRNHQYVSGDAGVEASVYLLCSTPRCFWSLVVLHLTSVTAQVTTEAPTAVPATSMPWLLPYSSKAVSSTSPWLPTT